jgi:nucleoside-diphosphate-sugar epimerase
LPLVCLRVAARLGDGIGFITRRDFPLNSETVERLTGSAWYSSEKIRRELDFQPAHTLIDALPEMIAHYRRHNT